MTKHDFADFARDLSAYYGRQAFTPDRLAMIFPKVEHIPSHALPWIFSHITDTIDNIPSNIGKALMTGYQAWMDATPGAKAKSELKDCTNCNMGLLFVERPMLDGRGLPLTYRGRQEVFTAAFGCTECEQAPTGIPRISKMQMHSGKWERQRSENAAHREEYRKRNEDRKNGKKNLPDMREDDDFERSRRMRHIPESEQAESFNLPF